MPNENDTMLPPASVLQPTNVVVIDIDPNEFEIETFFEWSLLNTICCLFTGSLVLICAVPAMLFSLKTRALNAQRRFNDALEMSKNSRNCNLLASLVIIQCLILTVIITNLVWLRNHRIG